MHDMAIGDGDKVVFGRTAIHRAVRLERGCTPAERNFWHSYLVCRQDVKSFVTKTVHVGGCKQKKAACRRDAAQ